MNGGWDFFSGLRPRPCGGGVPRPLTGVRGWTSSCPPSANFFYFPESVVFLKVDPNPKRKRRGEMATRGSRSEKVKRIFQQFDANRDGGLNRDEMEALVVAVNPRVKFSEEQINAILDEVFRTYGEFIDGEKGLTYEGLLWTYDDGAGDVDRDFDALELELNLEENIKGTSGASSSSIADERAIESQKKQRTSAWAASPNHGISTQGDGGERRGPYICRGGAGRGIYRAGSPSYGAGCPAPGLCGADPPPHPGGGGANGAVQRVAGTRCPPLLGFCLCTWILLIYVD
ncbi:hypothetical protein I3842_03G059800 [Carya illinoinensis]|uniref:EF-hand domain-containing protein n=1 Tax=Carya illinoinensis TaxID=32201 RepID=A0A922FH08_CARIL|nr:hypothetical protein I3842_03G059800 [Carya illinoinensis]